MKKYINQVLGNSLRCILPSFWWKRLLGMMADRIERAEKTASSASTLLYIFAEYYDDELSWKQDKLTSGSNIKTINGESVLGSGDLKIGVKTVGSVEELNALDAKAGDIAAALSKSLRETTLKESYSPDLKKNPIKALNVKDVQNIASGASIFLYFKSPNGSKYSLVAAKMTAYFVNASNTDEKYILWPNNELDSQALSAVNNILSNGEFYYTGNLESAAGDYDDETHSYISQFIEVYTIATDADAYIKGDTWKRLADKEYVDEKVAALEARIAELEAKM